MFTRKTWVQSSINVRYILPIQLIDKKVGHRPDCESIPYL